MAMSPREWWRRKQQQLGLCNCQSLMIASPQELSSAGQAMEARMEKSAEERLARAHQCTDEGVRAGLKAGAVASVVSAVPTLLGARYIPWAKKHVNYTGQALIISAATIAAYFIVAEQTILECARSSKYSEQEVSNGRAGSGVDEAQL